MATKVSASSIVVMSPEQVASELAGETVILNLKSGVYFGLDAVGTSVWQLLGEPRAVSEIAAALADEYDVELEQCRLDLLVLLQDLSAQGLIEVVGETA